jgi:predicted nucleic acid-binding protein
MGFLRVSLSPAYGANFDDALSALAGVVRMRGHRFLQDATQARSLPWVTSGKEVTDAHLIQLARRYRMKLATFDIGLCAKSWAAGIAEDPTA